MAAKISAAEIIEKANGRIRVVRFRERYVKCASCRSDAAGRLLIDDKPGATVCHRHVNVWVRRAWADLDEITKRK